MFITIVFAFFIVVALADLVPGTVMIVRVLKNDLKLSNHENNRKDDK